MERPRIRCVMLRDYSPTRCTKCEPGLCSSRENTPNGPTKILISRMSSSRQLPVRIAVFQEIWRTHLIVDINRSSRIENPERYSQGAGSGCSLVPRSEQDGGAVLLAKARNLLVQHSSGGSNRK